MEKKICVIDRFEGEYAVVEYGKETFNIPKALLNSDIKEGDVININVTVNNSESTNIKNRVEELSKKLFKK